jgi:hypothetical protein
MHGLRAARNLPSTLQPFDLDSDDDELPQPQPDDEGGFEDADGGGTDNDELDEVEAVLGA